MREFPERHGTNPAPDHLTAKAGGNSPGFQPHRAFVSKGTAMSIDNLEPALEGKNSHDGGRLPVEKVIHDAVADVEEGLEFWKTIAGNSASQRHASREFLNRQG